MIVITVHVPEIVSRDVFAIQDSVVSLKTVNAFLRKRVLKGDSHRIDIKLQHDYFLRSVLSINQL